MKSAGVKDSLAMPTINRLLAIGKALRRSTATRKAVSISDTEKVLRGELQKLDQEKLVNPLFGMPGRLRHSSLTGKYPLIVLTLILWDPRLRS